MSIEYFKEAREFYESKGIGVRVGFGEKPAVIVVDFQNAFTDASYPLGADYTEEVNKTRVVLDLARAKDVLNIFTITCYQDNLLDAGMWAKKMNTQKYLKMGERWAELDERLGHRKEEKIIYKNYASAFFATSLSSMLIANRVDTLIVTGCVTSGCIRATVVDALSLGYRVIVPEQCVGDRHPVPHEANLFDIDMKYGDVVDVKEVIGYLENLNHK